MAVPRLLLLKDDAQRRDVPVRSLAAAQRMRRALETQRAGGPRRAAARYGRRRASGGEPRAAG